MKHYSPHSARDTDSHHDGDMILKPYFLLARFTYSHCLTIAILSSYTHINAGSQPTRPLGPTHQHNPFTPYMSQPVANAMAADKMCA